MTINDSPYRSLDHAMEILCGCTLPYSCEQAQAVARALKQWHDKWATLVDSLGKPDPKIAALEKELATLRAPVTDAEIETAIANVQWKWLLLARREADDRVDASAMVLASQASSELLDLIARRIAQAGAAAEELAEAAEELIRSATYGGPLTMVHPADFATMREALTALRAASKVEPKP